jgi:uncharacterized OB-fold protein
VSAPRAARPAPLPADPAVEPFWAAVRDHRLEMQRCDDCGYVRWPPGRRCPECLSERGTWTELSGRGALWSFAIYHHSYDPEFASSLPYNVALVRLAEGPMIISNLVVDRAEDAAMDQPVTAVYDDVSPELTLLRFVPDSRESA